MALERRVREGRGGIIMAQSHPFTPEVCAWQIGGSRLYSYWQGEVRCG